MPNKTHYCRRTGRHFSLTKDPSPLLEHLRDTKEKRVLVGAHQSWLLDDAWFLGEIVVFAARNWRGCIVAVTANEAHTHTNTWVVSGTQMEPGELDPLCATAFDCFVACMRNSPMERPGALAREYRVSPLARYIGFDEKFSKTDALPPFGHEGYTKVFDLMTPFGPKAIKRQQHHGLRKGSSIARPLLAVCLLLSRKCPHVVQHLAGGGVPLGIVKKEYPNGTLRTCHQDEILIGHRDTNVMLGIYEALRFGDGNGLVHRKVGFGTTLIDSDWSGVLGSLDLVTVVETSKYINKTEPPQQCSGSGCNYVYDRFCLARTIRAYLGWLRDTLESGLAFDSLVFGHNTARNPLVEPAVGRIECNRKNDQAGFDRHYTGLRPKIDGYVS